MTFLFASGVDSGCPTLADGTRVDQMDACGHYARWEEDFELARELGVQALRYGPAYYRAHVGPERFDWDTCDGPLRRLRALGIAPIATLCRFGVPRWLGGFQDPAFPVLFAEYARAFARRFPWVRHYTPIDQIARTAAFSALHGIWNECERGERPFVRALRNLCLAHELAVEAILAERPDAVIVQVESVEHGHPAGESREDHDWRDAIAHLALDLTLGQATAPGILGWLNARGVDSNDIAFLREPRAVGQRWLGVAHHPTGERRTSAAGGALAGHELCRLGAEHFARYRLPLFHAETGAEAPDAERWLREQWDDAMRLRAAGVPLRGFTWYALSDHVETREALDGTRVPLRCAGLFDATREPRAVGEAFARLARRCGPALREEPAPGEADRERAG